MTPAEARKRTVEVLNDVCNILMLEIGLTKPHRTLAKKISGLADSMQSAKAMQDLSKQLEKETAAHD